jgi:Protein of unknown function (DUF2778)
MTTLTGASYYSTPSRRDRSRGVSPLHVISGAGFAFVVAASAWTLYSNMRDTTVSPLNDTIRAKSIAANVDPASFADRFGQNNTFADRYAPSMTFADRFGAMGNSGSPATTTRVAKATAAKPTSNTVAAATSAEPAMADRKVAWFDPTYSMGAPPEAFHRDEQPVVAAVSTRPQDLQTPPTVRQLVASIPLPQNRPAEARVASAPAAAPESRVAMATENTSRAPTIQNASNHELMVQRARATVAAALSNKPSLFEKLFGKGQTPASGTVLAYAGSDGGVMSDGREAAAPEPFDRQTAIYDISAKVVYLPDGTRLEAHSGLGSRLDDPRSANEKMRGVTPPHVYDLTLREAMFHGVQALRLTPVGGDASIYGRNGLLAHTFMLGPNGDSNGCVSFRDYNAFLRAYRNGDVKKLVVVAKL